MLIEQEKNSLNEEGRTWLYPWERQRGNNNNDYNIEQVKQNNFF